MAVTKSAPMQPRSGNCRSAGRLASVTRGWMVDLNAGVGKLDSACLREGLFRFGESARARAGAGLRAHLARSVPALATVTCRVSMSRQPGEPVSVDSGRKFAGREDHDLRTPADGG